MSEGDDYQRAVAVLLRNPLVTARHPDDGALPLVRRFQDRLRTDLAEHCGYHVELSDTCARLVRVHDRLDPHQRLRVKRSSGWRDFDRRRLVYLALVLCVLDTADQQVTLRELASTLARAVADVLPEVGFDDTNVAHRRSLVDALSWLEQLGALRQVDRRGGSWEADPSADLLYDIDRGIVGAVFLPPRRLDRIRAVGELLAEPPVGGRDARRQMLRRRMARLVLDHPVVYDADLDEEESTWLRREHRSLAATIEELTGAQLERRAEGIALVAPRSLSGWPFPDSGTVTQASLLLVDRMHSAIQSGELASVSAPGIETIQVPLRDALDAALPPSTVGDDEEDDSGSFPLPSGTPGAPGTPLVPFAPWVWIEVTTADLCGRHGKAFSADYRDAPEALARDVIALLVRFDLVRYLDGGVAVMPGIARYRSVVVRQSDTEPGLFDEGAGT